jgi:predicted ATP-binding protein involved in virulence
LEISFSATNLTVFIGANGQGKSSVLDLIAAHLNQLVTSLITNFTRRTTIDGILKDKDIYNFSDAMRSEIRFLAPLNYPAKNNNNYQNLTDSITLSRKKPLQKNKIEKELLDFCEEISSNSSSNSFLALPTFVYYRANRTVKDMIYMSDAKPDEFFEQFRTYQDAFSQTNNDFDGFFNWFKLEEDKENQLIRQEKNFDIRNPQLEVVRQAITYFFNFLSGDKYDNLRIERADKLFNQGLSYQSNAIFATLIINKNNESLSLSQLSDGEKSVIILICDIARRLAIANPIDKNADFSSILQKGNGVVLIDEIDLHLHPLWQKEILQALVKTFPSLQFIVTTHSPYVVTHLDLDDSQVQVLSITKNSVTPIASKGKDLSTASFEVFGVERRPKQYQSLIDDLFQEFEADVPNLSVLDRKFLNLKKRLGETDPEVESAKIILEGLKL